jgi:hypothetical protein
MKKIFTLLAITIFSTSMAFAQKALETKTAQIRFIAVDDKDIDAVNKQVVSRLEPNGKLIFSGLAKGFHFDMGKMEEHFNSEYIESNKFPNVLFTGQVTNYNTVNLKKDGKYPVSVSGNMQVHGVNKAITTNGIIEVKGGIVIASAQFTVAIKDFGIGGIMIKLVADKINIDVTATYQ